MRATLDAHAVAASVAAVRDPELADVTIGELGLVVDVVVNDDGSVAVDLVPTFLGCPALGVIAADVRRAGERAGATNVVVRWRTDICWTTERVRGSGRAKLARLGIAVDTSTPPAGPQGDDDSASCPDCRGRTLNPLGDVGPTACRALAWCTDCRSPVEILRDPVRRSAASAGA